MRLLSAALFLLMVAMGVAQPFTRLWIRTTSRPLTDTYADLVVDSAGNTFICGSSVNPTTIKYDMLVVKFDKNGVKLWEKTFPGTSDHSVAQAIALDPNGHVVVAGQTTWAPPADGKSRVIKVSAAGQLLWDNVGTASVGSYWYDVAVDRLGEVTTTGYINNGSKVMRTSHFLANGTLAWSRDYTYPGLTVADQAGRYVKVDADQNIFVCGVNNGFPGNVYNTIAKYTRTSSQVWMRHIHTGYRDYPRGFVQMPGNRYAVTMESTRPSPNSGMEGLTVVLDGNGTEVSRESSSNGPGFSTRGFAGDRDGNLFLAAETTSSNSVKQSYLESFPALLSGWGFIGFTTPDLRALAGGAGGGDFYTGSLASGSGARPATIKGFHIPGGDVSQYQYEVWSNILYGSSANGQVPYAIPTGMVTDSKGDLYVILEASGSNNQDGLFVKYETGPVARDDVFNVTPGQLFTSPPRAVLFNDSQVSQGTVSLETPPAVGVVNLNANGSFTYMPGPDFQDNDSFSYTVTRTNGMEIRGASGRVQIN